MAILLEPVNAIFTAAPGTGSTSLVDALLRSVGHRRMTQHDEGRLKHRTVAELIRTDVVPADHGWAIVTTTRNPFDYWPSEWLRTRTRWAAERDDPTSWVNEQPDMRRRIDDALRMDFKPWLHHVLEPHRSGGREMHLNRGHVEEAHLVLRSERLAQELRTHFGSAVAPIRRLNTTSERQDYRAYYGHDERVLVEQVFAPTFERFRYRF